MTPKTRIELALALHEQDIPVIKLPAGRKEPPPREWRRLRAADQDPAEVARFAEAGNIGLPTGTASGIDVVDIDPKPRDGETVEQARDRVLTETGLKGIPAPAVISPTGGMHLYFAHNQGLRNSAKRLHAEVDVRAEGGYVVLPGSIHPNGGTYEWAPGRSIFDVELPEVPETLLAMLTVDVEHEERKMRVDTTCDEAVAALAKVQEDIREILLTRAREELDAISDEIAGTAEGARNTALNACAFRCYKLANAGLLGDDGADLVTDELEEAAIAAGLEKEAALATLKSARAGSDGKAVDVGARAFTIYLERVVENYLVSKRRRQQGPACSTVEVPEFPRDTLPPAVEEELWRVATIAGDHGARLYGPLALTVLSAAAMRAVDCAVFPGKDPCPTGIMIGVSLLSGGGKNEAFRRLSRKIIEREMVYESEHRLALKRHEAEMEMHKARRKKRATEHGRSPMAGHAPNEELDRQQRQDDADRIPERPKTRGYLQQNVTPEALVESMAGTVGECAFILDAEGTFIEIMLGGYSGKTNVNDICNLWSGDYVSSDRVRRESGKVTLYQPRLAAAVAMQPIKVRAIATNDQAREQGLVARFLWSVASLVQRPWAEISSEKKLPLDAWDRLVSRIIAFGVKDKKDSIDATKEARDQLGELFERVRLRGQEYRDHQPWANRVVEHACRLSVVIELAWRPESREVQADSMARAIRVIEFHEAAYMELFAEPDPVREFARARIRTNPAGKLLQSGLHDAFAEFCTGRGFAVVQQQPFWDRLKALLHLPPKPKGKPRYFPGYELAVAAEVAA